MDNYNVGDPPIIRKQQIIKDDEIVLCPVVPETQPNLEHLKASIIALSQYSRSNLENFAPNLARSDDLAIDFYESRPLSEGILKEREDGHWCREFGSDSRTINRGSLSYSRESNCSQWLDHIVNTDGKHWRANDDLLQSELDGEIYVILRGESRNTNKKVVAEKIPYRLKKRFLSRIGPYRQENGQPSTQDSNLYEEYERSHDQTTFTRLLPGCPKLELHIKKRHRRFDHRKDHKESYQTVDLYVQHQEMTLTLVEGFVLKSLPHQNELIKIDDNIKDHTSILYTKTYIDLKNAEGFKEGREYIDANHEIFLHELISTSHEKIGDPYESPLGSNNYKLRIQITQKYFRKPIESLALKPFEYTSIDPNLKELNLILTHHRFQIDENYAKQIVTSKYSYYCPCRGNLTFAGPEIMIPKNLPIKERAILTAETDNEGWIDDKQSHKSSRKLIKFIDTTYAAARTSCEDIGDLRRVEEKHIDISNFGSNLLKMFGWGYKRYRIQYSGEEYDW